MTKYRYIILLIIICFIGFSLRYLYSSDRYLHSWDESYHALVAKNMIQNPFTPTLYKTPLLPYDYTNWKNNSVWLHKPPLTLWAIAGSLKLFGNNELAVRIPSIILSTLSIALTFFIGKKLFGEDVGIIAAWLQAINIFILDITSGRICCDHVDTTLLFFVELGALLSYIKCAKQILPFIYAYWCHHRGCIINKGDTCINNFGSLDSVKYKPKKLQQNI